jgi:hypothetical protein
LVKDSLGLKTLGVYRISCESSAVCIDEMGHMIEECTKKHFEETVGLVELPHNTSRVILEAIEIRLHQNFNGEGGYQ